jgi:hypothetical protein
MLALYVILAIRWCPAAFPPDRHVLVGVDPTPGEAAAGRREPACDRLLRLPWSAPDSPGLPSWLAVSWLDQAKRGISS